MLLFITYSGVKMLTETHFVWNGRAFHSQNVCTKQEFLYTCSEPIPKSACEYLFAIITQTFSRYEIWIIKVIKCLTWIAIW